MQGEEINFLPKELRPKKKLAKSSDKGVILSEPELIKKNKALKNDKQKQKKRTFGIFGFGKQNKDSKPTNNNLRDERDALLAGIIKQDDKKFVSPKAVKEKIKIARSEVLVKRQSLFEKLKINKSFFNKFLNFFAFKKGKKKMADKITSNDFNALLKKNEPRLTKLSDNKILTTNKVEKKAVNEELPKIQPIKSPSQPVVELKDSAFDSKNKPLVGTNLIRGQEFIFFNWSKAIKYNIVFALLSIITVVWVWGYFVFMNKKQDDYISPLEKNLIAREEKLQKLNAEVDGLTALRGKVAVIKGVFANHVYWTDFFTFLEKNTLPGVYYDDFEGDLSGEYHLLVIAKDFNTMVAQMKIWQNESKYINKSSVINIETASIQSNVAGNVEQLPVEKFWIDLSVKQEIFYK